MKHIFASLMILASASALACPELKDSKVLAYKAKCQGEQIVLKKIRLVVNGKKSQIEGSSAQFVCPMLGLSTVDFKVELHTNMLNRSELLEQKTRPIIEGSDSEETPTFPIELYTVGGIIKSPVTVKKVICTSK